MTIQVRIDGSLITGRVELLEGTDGLATVAERGAVGQCAIKFDDPSGNLTVNKWSTLTVDETACDPTRVFTGTIVRRRIGRGPKNASSTARVWIVDVVDQNELLHRSLNRFIDNSAKRPAETDVARVAWLLTSRALSGIVYDRGLVSTANAGSYLEADCRRKFANEVLGELAPSAVKNFFVYYDQATGDPALWYGKDTSTAWTSLLRITSDGTHDDDSIFAPQDEAELLEKEPDNNYSGVDYGWRGDPIYVSSATNLAAIGHVRDAVYDTDRIGRLATAQTAALNWLNVRSSDEDTINVTIVVKNSRVNWVYAGQRIQVKFPHIPGFESYTYTRVRRRTVMPIGPDHYMIRLVLWVPPTPVSDAAVPAGDCDNPTDLASSGTITVSADHGTDGTYDAAILPVNGSNGNDGSDLTYTTRNAFVGGEGPLICYRGHWIMDLGSAKQVSSMSIYDVSTLSGAAPTSIWYSTTGLAGSWTDAGATITPNGEGWTISFTAATKRYWRLTTESCGVSLFYVPTLTFAEWHIFGCTPDEDPLPRTGEIIATGIANPESGDGSTTAYTTGAYKDGTLRVYIDGIRLVTDDYEETDPVEGTYTLNFTPRAGEHIETRYESR